MRVFLEDDLDPVRLESAEQMPGQRSLCGLRGVCLPGGGPQNLWRAWLPAFQAEGPSPGTSPLSAVPLARAQGAPLDLARVRALVVSAGKEPGVAPGSFRLGLGGLAEGLPRFVGLLGGCCSVRSAWLRSSPWPQSVASSRSTGVEEIVILHSRGRHRFEHSGTSSWPGA